MLGDTTGVTAVRLKSTQDDSTQDVEVSGLFVAIGHKPNSTMFEGQLELRDGYIQVQSGTAGMPPKPLSRVYSLQAISQTVSTVRRLLLQVQAVWQHWMQKNISMPWAN